ncbi:MAG: hypothetical protein DHS20C11_11070 [Lysobacteraceae bacterium]|nr:MAG: hypothetical protein DHS20C11_11070 [Xanthomonadaceae bacterium]
MSSVKSSEVAKRFGEFAQLAQHEAVEVTSYNRPYVAILSAREYERLRRLDRQAYRVPDLPAEIFQAIESAEPSTNAKAFDDEVG